MTSAVRGLATVRPADFLAARKASGHTQYSLALEVGVSDVLVSYVERGRRNLSLPVLFRAAEVLGCEITDIADVNVDAGQVAALAKAVQ